MSFTIKTADLIEAPLDWAVAKAARQEVWLAPGNVYPHVVRVAGQGSKNYAPSMDWDQGGPIMEREGIVPIPFDGPVAAYLPRSYHRGDSDGYGCINVSASGADASGPTVLIACMRAYVLSKLGDKVEVPAELIRTVGAA